MPSPPNIAKSALPESTFAIAPPVPESVVKLTLVISDVEAAAPISDSTSAPVLYTILPLESIPRNLSGSDPPAVGLSKYTSLRNLDI